MDYNTATQTVLDIGNINFEGNVIPAHWYKTITLKNGKADLIGINILSEIVYWYRPQIVRDESSGFVVSYNKKFKTDLLQKSYSQLADLFGLSKRQITEAIIRLEERGIIKRVFRDVRIESGLQLRNVLYIDIFPKVLMDITCVTRATFKRDTSTRLKGTRPTAKEGTYTETTTETTTDINIYNAPVARKNNKKVDKVSFEELSTDHIKDWLAEKRISGLYINHDENLILEKFKNYCLSKGKKYENYVAAYRNAFEWDTNKPSTRNNNTSKREGDYSNALKQGLVGTLKGQGGLTDLLA